MERRSRFIIGGRSGRLVSSNKVRRMQMLRTSNSTKRSLTRPEIHSNYEMPLPKVKSMLFDNEFDEEVGLR